MTNKFRHPRSRLSLIVLSLALGGCMWTAPGGAPGAMMTSPTPPKSANAATKELAAVEQVLDANDTASVAVPTITGVGFAVVSVQPGKSLNQRRLLAIRVARMEAMRSLTEQIHGLRIDSETKVAEAVMQSDSLRATVSGVIRGARTVSIEPKGSDTYEVVLEIDRDMIAQMLKIARKG